MKLSDAPTKSPVSSCVDVQGWYDSGGPEYTCDWYKTQDGCVQFGNDYSNFGFTANQACCVCGGGEEITPSPTLSPTSSPVATCVDLVEGWDDGDGPAVSNTASCSFLHVHFQAQIISENMISSTVTGMDKVIAAFNWAMIIRTWVLQQIKTAVHAGVGEA